MSVIVPTITTETLDEYTERLTSVSEFANRVHVDISDGEFAPTFLTGADDVYWPATSVADIHAMVARPSEYVQALVAKKPHLIIFHAEVQEDLLPILQYVRQQGIKAGIALLKPTVPASVIHLIQAVDHVMIFSGELGRHGGTASMMQLEKVRLIKAIRTDLEIGWDGGVLLENAFSLSQGGIDVLNVGGAISKSQDPEHAYAMLTSEINKHGVI